jgi:hypothetical protein
LTSREIVRRTLDFEGPERVARSFDESDFVGASPSAATRATEWRKASPGRWERTDEWGNTWARVDPTSKGEVARGVLDDLDRLGSYEFPDYSRPADYEPVSEARARHPDKWLIGSMPGFTFNVARKLRRLDAYLADLMLEPDRTRELHDRIDAVLLDMIRNHARAGADCVMFPEDWGTQDRLMISPDLWREEFRPRFERLCGEALRAGLRVFMHSCGKMTAIIPGLMEAGVGCLQFDQPELHGIDELARHQEKGKITFWCPVDIQKTLQTRDEGLIRAAAREMLDRLWRGRGGFIAGRYADEASIGLDPRWQDAASEEFRCWGVREGRARD